MKSLSFIAQLIAALLAVGCNSKSLQDGTDPNFFTGEIWSENGLAVVGGSLLMTEGQPFQTGTSASTCTTEAECIDPNTGAAGGPVLQYFLKDCQFSQFQSLGYWHAYQRMVFPSNAACLDAITNGFDSSVIASLAGQPLTRTYGLGQNGDQQENWRLANNGVAVIEYTDFPSGLADPTVGRQVQGGVQVTYNADGSRDLKILGTHLKGYLATNGTSFLVDNVFNWAQIGPGKGNVRIDYDETVSTDNADITVTGQGASKQITAYDVTTQHNIVLAAGHTTLLNNTPLMWSTADCCWPTSGTLRTEFTRAAQSTGPVWKSEDIVFQAPCGTIQYIEYSDVDGGGDSLVRSARLNHCQ